MMHWNDGSHRAATPEPRASARAVSPRRGRRDPQRRGFTLIEMVVAVSIMSVLMFGVASAILIASHATPQSNGPSQRISEGATVVDDLSEEVRTALWFIEHTPTAMTFTVPDRDNNGLPERIRYAWSGTPGDPLTRQYNGGTVVNVVDALQDFALTYDLKSVVEEYDGPAVQSGEILHNSYDGSGSVSPRDFTIDANNWIGEYFRPALPIDALTWSVTRVRFQAKNRGAPTGETLVQLRTAGARNRPTATILEQFSMMENTLPVAYAVQQFTFGTIKGLSPADGLCLVLQYVSGGDSARILYDNAASNRLKTSNAGNNWNLDNDKSMRFDVYGKYTSPGPPQTATRQYVTGVNVKLQPTNDDSSRIVTTAPTYNTPEVLSGLWLAEFDADPTLDHNGDGVDDWSTGGPPFNTLQLSGGVFWADGVLYNQPASNLDVLTTVELRFRDVGNEGQSGGIRLRVDRTGDTYAYVEADVKLIGSQQQLKITTWDNAVWVNQRLPVGQYIEVRFVVDPGPNTVYILVNGTDAGTFSYTRRLFPGKPQSVELYETAVISGVQFDYVHVRVGGTGS